MVALAVGLILLAGPIAFVAAWAAGVPSWAGAALGFLVAVVSFAAVGLVLGILAERGTWR